MVHELCKQRLTLQIKYLKGKKFNFFKKTKNKNDIFKGLKIYITLDIKLTNSLLILVKKNQVTYFLLIK
jgi:hypothetical protein